MSVTLELEDFVLEDALEAESSSSSQIFDDLPFLIAHDAAELIAHVAALNALGIGNTIVCASGTYALTDTITISTSHVNIIGAGRFASVISFVPTSAPAEGKPALDINGGATTLSYVSIKGFGFTSSNTTLKKIMVRVMDGEEIDISEVASSEGGWIGDSSIGVQVKGRQFVNIHDSTIAANVPINFGENPNGGPDCDHYHLWNLYLIANGAANYNIVIDDTVLISDLNIDGSQAWVKGAGGIVWHGTSAAASHSVRIHDVRHEQAEGTSGYLVDFSPTAGTISGVRIIGMFGGLGMRGIKLRRTYRASIENYSYIGSSVAFDIDSTCNQTLWLNSNAGSAPASVSITGQQNIFALSQPIDSTSPMRTTMFYETTDIGAISRSIILGGAKLWSATGTLANGAMFNILGDGQGAGDKSFFVIVSARNSVTNGAEGGSVVVSGGASGAAVIAAASTNFGVGNVGGKLTIFWQNMTTVSLFNQLAAAASVDYTVTVIWN